MNLTSKVILAIYLVVVAMTKTSAATADNEANVVPAVVDSVADSSIKQRKKILSKTKQKQRGLYHYHDSKKYSKKKSKKYNHPKLDYLEADIESFDNDDDGDESFKGKVWIEEDDGKDLFFDYRLKNGPKRCDDCLITIHSGRNCKNYGGKFFEKSTNPYQDDETYFLSNKKGDASGFFVFNNGADLWANRCKLVVLRDSDGDKIGCGELIPDTKDEEYCNGKY